MSVSESFLGNVDMMIDRQDVLYAVRSVQRTPLLTFLVVLALSIGIGLNAGVFTILDNRMFARLGFDPNTFAVDPVRTDPSVDQTSVISDLVGEPT